MAANTPVSGKLLTAEDYKTLTPPFGLGPRYELIEGELVKMVFDPKNDMAGPNRFHQSISRNLIFLIESHLRRHPVGEVYFSPLDVYLDDFNVLQPDIIFVSTARAADVLKPEGIVGAPDLVVEIFSPSTARMDKQRKRPLLARLGVGELWLIDPTRRQVEVYDLQIDAERPTAICGETDSLQTPLLPGLTIALSEVFAQRFA